MEILKGRIISYLYRNEENGYVIAKIETEDEKKQTIVGYLPALSTAVFYEFYGIWIEHNKFGKQFKVESLKSLEEQDETGLVSYLSSDYFTGIGPKTAIKIVDTLGLDAIAKIKNNPDILKSVGFNDVRIERFIKELYQNQTNEEMLVLLYSYGIIGKTAMKILNTYQIRTKEILEKNPYQLIEDIEGIGFLRADEIAQKIGIDKNDMRRIKASILYAFEFIAYQNGDLYLFEDEVIKYSHQILQSEIDLTLAIEDLVNSKHLIREDEKLYLATAYHTELSVAEHIQRINNGKKDEKDLGLLETLLNMVEIQKNIKYTELQKEAILTSLNSKIAVITGGPGTGKTTIIDGLLEVYKHYHKLDFKNPQIYQRISLMAPTGRAAKRMKELLDMNAQTIHRQLGFGYDGYYVYDETHQLPHDLIIVDESSMIDIFLAKRLFQAIKDDAHVIIVGDVDQLPSVGPGQVLADIIKSNEVSVIKLTEIHRQAKDSNIIKLAHKVNIQNVKNEDLVSENDVYLYKTTNDKIKDIIINQIDGALKQGYNLIDDIQVLIPMYKGDVGIDAINQVLQEKFNPNKHKSITFGQRTYYEGDKVIQLANDPDRLIMNGDIGYIKRITRDDNNHEVCIIKFDDNEVLYEKQDLESINLAYAMSIHKSQGSEYKIVIMPMVKNFMHMLKKELIYTAITRAKKFLIILGDITLLSYAANNLSDKRKTSLDIRLKTEELPSYYDTVSPYDF